MILPHCTRCGQPRTGSQLYRGICGSCRVHSCTVHEPGTPACYIRCECRCGRCGRAHTKREQYRKMRAAQGIPALIDATGVKRRIHALMALGWTAKAIATVAGLNSDRAVQQYLLPHRKTVTPATSSRISEAYAALSMQIGPSAVTRSRAAAAGYPPPLAWDDGTGPHGIDNPDATPAIGTIRKLRTPAEKIAELDMLTGSASTDEIARRLGYKDADSMATVLTRAGHTDAAHRIRAGRAA